MNDQSKKKDNIAHLPASTREAENIMREAQKDAGYDRMMKFKKGVYYVDNAEVPLGTQFVAHAIGWAKAWIKFENGKRADYKVYRILSGESPPDRDQLGDMDQDKWETSDMTRQPKDPWTKQNLLPLENEAGDHFIFVSGSTGGARAVSDLCAAWARKSHREPACGQPIVKLRTVMMPSKRFGNVPRPHFEIVGWDGGSSAPVREVQALSGDSDMDDEIPF